MKAIRYAVVAYVALLVALPLATLVVSGVGAGSAAMRDALTGPVARDALVLTLWTAALVAAVNAIAGTATAWVLARHRIPGRRFVSALVDLPLAIPTLVTGVMLALLLGPSRSMGGWLDARDVHVLYAPPAIVLALLFITVPFVVRAVEPVLRELDRAEEEAAHTLGASRWTTFRRVTLPALRPAIVAGALQCFARAIAEFGSIVVVSGNIPRRTLVASVLVHAEVESGRPDAAAAVSVVLLAIALALSLGARWFRMRATGGRASVRLSPAVAP